jgi:hypothetical protein
VNNSMQHFLTITVALCCCYFTGCNDASVSQSPAPSSNPVTDAQPVPDPPLAAELIPETQARNDNLSQTSNDPAFTDQKIGLSFPRSVAGLNFEEHHPYPQEEMGYSVRYDNDDLMKVDIYVYNNGLADISTGHTGVDIIREVGNAEAGIRYYEERGAYRDVKKLDGGVYPPSAKDSDVAFQFSIYQYSQSARPGVAFTGVRASETFITGFKNHFIKVRVTYPKATSENSIKTRDQFLQQLADLIRAD